VSIAAPDEGMSLRQRALYTFGRNLILFLCRALFALTMEGTDHIPAEEAFVLAPVHRSNVDFGLMGCLTRRRMRFMAKDSLWRVPLLGALLDALGAYPVNREAADREALRRTEECLRRGEPVVMFPEGTRSSGPRIEHVFEGVAWVAARNGVPIVPVGIGGSERALPKGARVIRPVRIHLIVGEPIVADWTPEQGRPPRRVVHTLSEQVRSTLQELFDRADARVGIERVG
jgi:1-acyl-sn-glycerol-3-phosphate acyltransferase